MDLDNKSVYLFCPSVFGYDYDIKSELELIGAKVRLFDERVYDNIFFKILLRLNFRFIIKYFIKRFYKLNLLSKINQVDLLILINPETIDVETIEQAKLNNPRLKVITYMWDSFRNKPFSKGYIECSDSFFTFDKDDASAFNLKFLPLFYANSYSGFPLRDAFEYSFSFVGTAHSDRFNIVSEISKFRDNNFLFFYCPSKLVFLYKKIIKNELHGLNINDISFSTLSRAKVIDVVKKSQVIVDVNHPSQSGLTMRTIEVIGAQRKLITTNANVLLYNFYNPHNILYYNKSMSNKDLVSFLSKPYQPIDTEIYNQYSIREWVKSLINNK